MKINRFETIYVQNTPKFEQNLLGHRYILITHKWNLMCFLFAFFSFLFSLSVNQNECKNLCLSFSFLFVGFVFIHTHKHNKDIQININNWRIKFVNSQCMWILRSTFISFLSIVVWRESTVFGFHVALETLKISTTTKNGNFASLADYWIKFVFHLVSHKIYIF